MEHSSRKQVEIHRFCSQGSADDRLYLETHESGEKRVKKKYLRSTATGVGYTWAYAMSKQVGQTGDLESRKTDAPDLDAAMPALYQELRRMAKQYLSRERPDHTLQPTALVHEAYLRLLQQHKVDWLCRTQVLGVAARMMRRILVNYAVARSAQKRGAALLVSDPHADVVQTRALEIEYLDLALNHLEEIDPRQARIVELRFFSGLTVDETAAALGVSAETVKREWRTARLWLARELAGRRGGVPHWAHLE
jgi:RNA polymerase sigma factor (TIGR02999 family)